MVSCRKHNGSDHEYHLIWPILWLLSNMFLCYCTIYFKVIFVNFPCVKLVCELLKHVIKRTFKRYTTIENHQLYVHNKNEL